VSGTLILGPVTAVSDRLAAGATPLGGYLVRPVRTGDADLIRDFIRGLSVRTQYFRFFTAVSSPSAGLLRMLSGGGRSDILLVIDEQGAVIGHGMAVDSDATTVASTTVASTTVASTTVASTTGEARTDIGLVVADSWQGQGLGTMLLGLLVARAVQRGVVTLQLEVLPANNRMLGIISRRWPDADWQRTADAVSITADISRKHESIRGSHDEHRRSAA
jgi:GNAT superfamily N-acetyltransferase